MSPLSRGIFIIVSGAAEWVWCFILAGILCAGTARHLPPRLPPPPSLSGSWRKKTTHKKNNERGGLKANSLLHRPILPGDWWQMACFKINLSINSGHCSLPRAFTAVCRPADCILSGRRRRRTWPSPYRCKLFIYCHYLDVTNAVLWFMAKTL